MDQSDCMIAGSLFSLINLPGSLTKQSKNLFSMQQDFLFLMIIDFNAINNIIGFNAINNIIGFNAINNVIGFNVINNSDC